MDEYNILPYILLLLHPWTAQKHATGSQSVILRTLIFIWIVFTGNLWINGKKKIVVINLLNILNGAHEMPLFCFFFHSQLFIWQAHNALFMIRCLIKVFIRELSEEELHQQFSYQERAPGFCGGERRHLHPGTSKQSTQISQLVAESKWALLSVMHGTAVLRNFSTFWNIQL